MTARRLCVNLSYRAAADIVHSIFYSSTLSTTLHRAIAS
jgi:hypothetical protein